MKLYNSTKFVYQHWKIDKYCSFCRSENTHTEKQLRLASFCAGTLEQRYSYMHTYSCTVTHPEPHKHAQTIQVQTFLQMGQGKIT